MAINHVWKTVIALFLCVLTLFAFGLKLAVQAHAFAISASVIGLIAVILGTLGITFATSAELQRVCTQYYNQAPADIQNAFSAAAADVVDGVILWSDWSTAFAGLMSTIIASLVSYTSDGVDYQMINGVNDYVYSNSYNVDGYAYSLSASSLEVVSFYKVGTTFYSDLGTTSSGDLIKVKLDGGTFQSDYFKFSYSIYQDDVRIFFGSCDSFYRASVDFVPASGLSLYNTYLSVAPCKMLVDGVECLSIVFAVMGADGIRRYFGTGDAVTGFNLTDFGTTAVTDYYGEAGAIDDGIIGQAWDTANDQTHSETDVITLTDSMPWTAAQSTDVIDVGYTQSDVLTDVGIQDIVQDITSTVDVDLPLDIDDYKVPPAWTNPSSGQTIRFADIFPFCIPFDIYDFLSLMSAARTAPHFEIPFKYDRIGLDYTFVIDLSGTEWENLAQIVRTLELIAFCVGLAFVTRDLIKG